LAEEAPLHRAPRVARGERVLPVTLRGRRHPHDGRGRRVGDEHRRRGPRQQDHAAERDPVPPLPGAPLLRVTYFTGFKVNSGEYKLMGLAPYGEPTYADRIRSELIDIRDDGSF